MQTPPKSSTPPWTRSCAPKSTSKPTTRLAFVLPKREKPVALPKGTSSLAFVRSTVSAHPLAADARSPILLTSRDRSRRHRHLYAPEVGPKSGRFLLQFTR